MAYRFLFVFLFVAFYTTTFAQEADSTPLLKNQISTNVTYLPFGSLDLSYERTLGKRFAIGVGGTYFGGAHKDLNLESQGSYDHSVNYEVNLFTRVYLQGTQNKSHFFELFGSVNETQEFGAYNRHVNTEGYGVYTIGIDKSINIGLGGGYGYRFLLLDKKLVLEAQVALRTNFIMEYLFLDVAIVRTGIKVGYRF